MDDLAIEKLATDILAQSKTALSKAITLNESTLQTHREISERILELVNAKSKSALRLGISGPPGVGKSTFIDMIGNCIIRSGKKLAVLTIDPSSPVSGGSILGDKTRMASIAGNESVFIRPSPSSGVSGGVGIRTRQSIELCEAGGHDIVIVETVGVGQLDSIVASMTDIFVQLHLPNSGDELQGIKKGSTELANIILVTKADGPSKDLADIAVNQLTQSIQITNSTDILKKILKVSKQDASSILNAYEYILFLERSFKASGDFQRKRRNQLKDWLNQEFESVLIETAKHSSHFLIGFDRILEDLSHGACITIHQAAKKLVMQSLK